MARRTYTPEQIINKLRKVEILLSRGSTVAEAVRQLGVTEQTYYRWRKEYGGIRVEQLKDCFDYFNYEKTHHLIHISPRYSNIVKRLTGSISEDKRVLAL
ncbi:transposase [Chloroflexota bacterium]